MDRLHLDDQRWRLDARGRRWFDIVLVSVLLLPVAAFPFAGVDASWTLLGLAQLVPLYLRRHHPVPVFAVVALASAAQALVIDSPLWSQLAFPIATYSLARYAAPRWGLAGLAVGVLAAAVASVDWLRGFDTAVTPSTFLPYFLTIGTVVVTSWALGALARTRQSYVDALVERGQRLEREAAVNAELAASAERARIAREMHDVVAHGLSVMVVQAEGARYAAAREPETAADALGTIASVGRESLTEMRRLLGLLRSEEVAGTLPQPRLHDLTSLVEDARAAGTTVHADLPDTFAPVPDGVALTAYRVAQEALTNVRKHAGPAAEVTVRLAVGDDAVTLRVEDDGHGASAPDDGRGLGLVGMRERVAVHDGTLQVGPRAGGGYRVCARIPL